mmetsp:Transcript_46214/g.118752  ORF Transcript_46214/g.118752 Transcript_46214/m.118752 type:complete len:224 (-) Transcript_46214:102-773(-)
MGSTRPKRPRSRSRRLGQEPMWSRLASDCMPDLSSVCQEVNKQWKRQHQRWHRKMETSADDTSTTQTNPDVRQQLQSKKTTKTRHSRPALAAAHTTGRRSKPRRHSRHQNLALGSPTSPRMVKHRLSPRQRKAARYDGTEAKPRRRGLHGAVARATTCVEQRQQLQRTRIQRTVGPPCCSLPRSPRFRAPCWALEHPLAQPAEPAWNSRTARALRQENSKQHG